MSTKSNIDDLINDLNIKGSTYDIPKSDSDSRKLLDDLYGDINSGFEYKAEEDPVYAAEKKAYEREADRTMRDTLAQSNSRTNGFTNSAAITAASQARDYTMAKFNDRAAELEDRAYTKRQNQISAKMQLLSALESMEARERANYLDELDRIEAKQSSQQDEARQMVSDMISMGQIPSQELLDATGLNKEYLDAQMSNMFSNMDTASMQRYLNSKGYNLSVDGSWGPKTEAAFQAEFGRASGRQSFSGYSGGGGGNMGRSIAVSDSSQTVEPTSGFNGSSYDDAQAYMKQHGVDAYTREGMASEKDWNFAKHNKVQTPEARGAFVLNNATYADYVREYVAYATSREKGQLGG